MAKLTCKLCGAEKFQGTRHAHCGGCGNLLGSPHAITCPRSGVPRGAVCPKCKRLLAAGAWCPTHGDPLVYDASEREGAPK